MTILLQYNKTEKNSLNKDTEDIITLTGTLKAETSIIDPVIIIEYDLAELENCNYMTIHEFGRTYFIRNIRSIRNGLVEISGHVDVLTSFRSQIRSNTAIIKRQENDWNLYLNDGVFKVYQNPKVFTVPFPSGFNRQEYVLAVAGG